jgi:lysophospholipase L1-like esterase
MPGLFISALSIAAHAAGTPAEHWVGAWGFPATSARQPGPATGTTAAPGSLPGSAAAATPPRQRMPSTFNNVTVRQIVRISAPARRLRIRLSNEFGDQPLRLGAVHVALAGADGAILPDSDHALTFSGQTAMTIPADAPLLSDPLDWQVPALATLAVSIYLPDETPSAAHRVAEYVSTTGNYAGTALLPGAELVRGGALVSEVDIASPTASRTVVTLGDSITEGVGSTTNAFRGWSDRLAERLGGNAATRAWSVVNAGIGSNRLLHNNPGQGALARFDRDVLSTPGVTMVIMLEGINDIGYSQTTPAEAVGADEIIAAYRQIIARAHAHGIEILAGTITPFEGSHYYDAKGEELRHSVNAWIRGGRAFDGVIDFDAALRDPADPNSISASLHRGDHLHPNDAGYAAMADAIDLQFFTGSAPGKRKKP